MHIIAVQVEQVSKMVRLIVESGVLTKLVEFLSRDTDNSLQLAATSMILMLSNSSSPVYTSENVEELVRLGVIQPLVHLLGSSHTEESRLVNISQSSAAAGALGNITREGPDYRDLILQSGVIEPLLKLLENHETSDLDSVRMYAWALTNLCQGTPKPDFNITSPQHY